MNLRLYVGAVTLYQAVPAENDYYSLSTVHFCGCVFSRFGLSRGNTKLLGHVSHLIIPACRRGACATLVLEKYDPTLFGRREDRSFYLGDKSKFPASLLFGVSRISLQFSRYSDVRCSPCTSAVLNFNERFFYRDSEADISFAF